MSPLRHWSASALVAVISCAGTMAQSMDRVAPSPLGRVSATRIDVDYQAANLRTVLRQLAEIGGVNLVIDPSVPTGATLDIRLIEVPWDQVMGVVLKAGGLSHELDGTVLRVLSREARARELAEEARRVPAGQPAGGLETARVRLSYSTAAAMAKLVQQARLLSGRGTVEFEERANMLIVQDAPANIAEIRTLLSDLDRPEPQVEIEARIVRTNRDTARALGVQWGMNGRVAPDLGNTTAAAFPNRGTLTGRVQDAGPVTQGPTDPRATILERSGTAVNLPATAATTAIGLSLGAVNGAFSLDVALSALAHEGRATILSTPRVTTQNNKLAEITQGFEVPIQIVANNTVTVQFKPAALKLTVTPQVTEANTVIMRIYLENATPDFSRAVNGNPSINTQRAETQVQVADGATTIIGGILQASETMSDDRTPGVARLPLVGRLFRRTETRRESQELVIFITPRIIRG
jgi:type IV pilus assembly protein PilQ